MIDTYKELEDNGFDADEIKEILEQMEEHTEDFEHGNYRFIHASSIDDVLKDELSNDTYILGCFNDWFIADITGLDVDAVTKAQKNESYELLGELMLQHIDEVVENYVSADGYGHHFSGYDGSEELIGDYYMFRVN